MGVNLWECIYGIMLIWSVSIYIYHNSYLYDTFCWCLTKYTFLILFAVFSIKTNNGILPMCVMLCECVCGSVSVCVCHGDFTSVESVYDICEYIFSR